jgi:N6-adenosine-specific RNA methylase IME4
MADLLDLFGGATQGVAARADPMDPLSFVGERKFATILADPPWQFTNRTGKVAPEHRRLARYRTLSLEEILALPMTQITAPTAHLYLWCPNALLPEGLAAMKAWGFAYKSNIVWHKIRKDGGSDGRGVGFYFRNVTELILFGVKGKKARTLAPGRRQVNYLATRSVNTRASPTKSIRSSRRAAPARISSFSPAAHGPAGRAGATRYRRPTMTRPTTSASPSTPVTRQCASAWPTAAPDGHKARE